MTPLTVIHNVTTGEILEREMTDSEITQLEKDVQDAEIRKLSIAETESKRAAAEAKLAALGLTADDLKALGL